MFERYTERARQVVVLGQEEARTMGYGAIGPEHLLLGLIREEEGLAARILERLGVEIGPVREAILREYPPVGPSSNPGEQIPFTPRGKRVLELALREALSLGHNYVGTEHVLLGLQRDGTGVVAKKVLQDLGVEAGTIRAAVMESLSGPARVTPRTREPTYEEVRSGLGRLRLRHSQYPELRGVLVGYDFDRDVCTVQIRITGIEGEFTAHRSTLEHPRSS